MINEPIKSGPRVSMANLLTAIVAAYLAGRIGLVGDLLDVTPAVADIAEVSP